MTVPAENTIVECRACHAKIFFARTENMKNQPLNAKPVRVMVCDPLGPGETQHKVRWIDSFVSHFSTCAQAEKFRRSEP